jgi:hypothetical protein
MQHQKVLFFDLHAQVNAVDVYKNTPKKIPVVLCGGRMLYRLCRNAATSGPLVRMTLQPALLHQAREQ